MVPDLLFNGTLYPLTSFLTHFVVSVEEPCKIDLGGTTKSSQRSHITLYRSFVLYCIL